MATLSHAGIVGEAEIALTENAGDCGALLNDSQAQELRPACIWGEVSYIGARVDHERETRAVLQAMAVPGVDPQSHENRRCSASTLPRVEGGSAEMRVRKREGMPISGQPAAGPFEQSGILSCPWQSLTTESSILNI